ncbi:hypothetical protein U1Q18_051028 [Sarracenia purpurea var. burkii]
MMAIVLTSLCSKGGEIFNRELISIIISDSACESLFFGLFFTAVEEVTGDEGSCSTISELNIASWRTRSFVFNVLLRRPFLLPLFFDFNDDVDWAEQNKVPVKMNVLIDKVDYTDEFCSGPELCDEPEFQLKTTKTTF